MNGRPLLKMFYPLLVLAVGLGPALGCGKKASPRPPRLRPPSVTNLTSSVEGDRLTLTWDVSTDLLDFQKDASGFIVYRSKLSLSGGDCLNCPPDFEPVADIQVIHNAAGGYVKDNWRYQETLETGYQYTYKVAAYTKSGSTGGDSNNVQLVH